MKRRDALVLCALFAGCGVSRKPLADSVPAELPGGWKRGNVAALPEVPELVSQFGPDESVRTQYSGPGSVDVRIFRMKAETSAFELIQKWRQSEGLAAYKGPHFFVATGDGAGDVLRLLQSSFN